ncbi:hypothetical protein FNV43_RR04594 [Rhamnella rubrinervis]|uniref:Uncharacterized protein n=1 Tax=Rhamnella rubrinervis TaxID=2594499 RepID=A0A8K0MPX5_9ROSA|nr:hypothetical protein FNV43_RR04594 [Rhamnella rubrinervis]
MGPFLSRRQFILGHNALLDRLVALRESSSLSKDEIFAEVLTEKSACFCGMSVSKKSKTYKAAEESAALRKELEEYKDREKENQAIYAKSLKKNKEMEKRLAYMEKKMAILVDLHEKRFD